MEGASDGFARRRRRVDDLPVVELDLPRLALDRVEVRRDDVRVLVAVLQEPLDAAGRVFGALALVPVRQEDDESRLAHPLGLARAEELVDDDLRAVDEVAELRLPDAQDVGGLVRVAELEAEDAVLREEAVVDGQLRRLVRVYVVDEAVLAAVVLVVDDGVPVRERAALDVLAREADGHAVQEQRAERQRLAERPVDALAGRHGLREAGEAAPEPAVELEAVGDRRQRGADGGERVRGRARLAEGAVADVRRRDDLLPVLAPDVAVPRERVLGLERPGEDVVDVRDDPRDVGGRHDGLRGRDRLEVLGQHRRLRPHLGVHHRLRERRFVDLVVAELAVADEVDDDVRLELVAPRDGGLEDAADRLGVVGVDVEDGRAERLAEVGRVHRASALLRRRREADLVVADDVDRPARPVRLERDHLHRLVDDALPGERGVAVDDHGQHGVAARVALGVHARARLADDERIDGLEVRRVREQLDPHLAAVGVRPVVRRAQVVLDVAGRRPRRAARGLVAGRPQKLAEDDLDGLPHDVAQHVEAPACARRVTPPPRAPPSDAGGARCGMPMMTSVTPQSVAASTMVFMPPIMDSQPSRPKRLAVLNLVARTFSNFSAKARRSRTCVRSSSVSGFRGTSMRDRSQFCLQRFVMCSASTPTVPQYLCGTQIYGAFVLNRRVDLHAIDATPARRRGGVGSSLFPPDALVDLRTGRRAARVGEARLYH